MLPKGMTRLKKVTSSKLFLEIVCIFYIVAHAVLIFSVNDYEYYFCIKIYSVIFARVGSFGIDRQSFSTI
jgi:hypothetical protein